jgi:hypothetical protein
LPEPSKTTVAEERLARRPARPHPKTAERCRQLAEQQIIPHLGNTVLQRLKPKHVKDWHGTLLKSGGKNGKPLSARAVGHAHRMLHRALERAVETEVLALNVASATSPPKVEDEEIEILTSEQIDLVLNKLEGHPLCAISALAWRRACAAASC